MGFALCLIRCFPVCIFLNRRLIQRAVCCIVIGCLQSGGRLFKDDDVLSPELVLQPVEQQQIPCIQSRVHIVVGHGGHAHQVEKGHIQHQHQEHSPHQGIPDGPDAPFSLLCLRLTCLLFFRHRLLFLRRSRRRIFYFFFHMFFPSDPVV